MFRTRRDAGRELGVVLARAGHGPDEVVVGVSRGGVHVALGVAEALRCPVDVFGVGKLAAPGREDLWFGAIGESCTFVDTRLRAQLLVDDAELREIERTAGAQVAKLCARVRGGHPAFRLEGRTAVVADDGIRTGATMRCALRGVRERGAARVILAVPVAPSAVLRELAAEADAVVCLRETADLPNLDVWYGERPPQRDEDVPALPRQPDFGEQVLIPKSR